MAQLQLTTFVGTIGYGNFWVLYCNWQLLYALLPLTMFVWTIAFYIYCITVASDDYRMHFWYSRHLLYTLLALKTSFAALLQETTYHTQLQSRLLYAILQERKFIFEHINLLGENSQTHYGRSDKPTLGILELLLYKNTRIQE